jgi:cysteine desulfurase
VLHTDAVQGVPWLDVAAAAAGADLVAISAHKFGGPKGTGALLVRDGVALQPLLEGGGQERGFRAGTVNVAGAVAMAAALQVTLERRDDEAMRIGRLRDRLASGLLTALPDCFFNGDAAHKVPGNCHIGFPGVEAETLLVALDRNGVQAAAGSSCSSGAAEPSHVLEAMGLSRAEALSSIRLSLGFASTDADVDRALEVIPDAAERVRSNERRASEASELAGAESVPKGGARRRGAVPLAAGGGGARGADQTWADPGAERVRPAR